MLWTSEELEILRTHYQAGRLFEDILEMLPNRTSNAVRLKASRLGIRRPVPEVPERNYRYDADTNTLYITGEVNTKELVEFLKSIKKNNNPNG